ncbi:long-chain fatty acid--CoA ligase [Microbacterium sp. RD1]|uniref:long-chain fatty acid--CoA ligase n=1 Tax=Microbacterium sp. RD1 TaxID=3457313 RepID=UPI003FA5A6C1
MLSTMQDEPLSLATLLRYASSFHADATVTTWEGDGARTTTFAEMGTQAARLANALSSLGVVEGDRVATFMWNNTEHQIAYIGVPAMGAVLHALNIRLPIDQVTYVATHAEDRVLIVDGSLLPLVQQYLPRMPTVRHVIVANGDASALEVPAGVSVHAWDEFLAAQPTTYDFPVLDERSAAAMCYTSGTTGDPKGVVYSHRSNWLHAMQVLSPLGMRIEGDDSILAIVPMFHANAWGLPYAALMAGTSLVMPDRFLQPAPLLEIMATLRPTFAAAVPTVWNGVLTQLASAPQDISHLRKVIIGGSAVPPAMIRAFEERHGVDIVHAWGMTETSPLGTVANPPAGVSGDDAWPYRVTQGRFSAGVQARLIGDDGAVVPNDGHSPGELEVRGPWITAGYYSPSGTDDNADAFHDGWLRTGDVGHISPDGYLTILDRSKDVIKSGGEWISSINLENLIASHPAVAEVAVVGVPDSRWDERPLASVVLRPDQSASAADLHRFVSESVARWQVPERWTFIAEVPKTSVGKFDKKLLRARYDEGILPVETIAADRAV